MLDLNYVRDNFERVRTALKARGFEPLIETLEKRDPEDWDPDQAK